MIKARERERERGGGREGRENVTSVHRNRDNILILKCYIIL